MNQKQLDTFYPDLHLAHVPIKTNLRYKQFFNLQSKIRLKRNLVAKFTFNKGHMTLKSFLNTEKLKHPKNKSKMNISIHKCCTNVDHHKKIFPSSLLRLHNFSKLT